MNTSFRLIPSITNRRGRSPIHAGFGHFVEKTVGCVSPFLRATTNKERHIYMFIRRYRVKAFIHAGFPRRRTIDEIRRNGISSTQSHFISSITSMGVDEMKTGKLACTT